ncbi:hypothetical protein BGX38DRAFT_1178875 [Terfezia claveryi]|nr:hypothetical protein BGX38DRAFT_1178875 [Terfezia claveryi]
MPTDTPMPRNLQLLHRILSIYPTLETILSFSHRGSVIQLSRTSRSLHSLLTSSINPLRQPFPLCAPPLNPCYHCHVLLCQGCKHEVRLPEGPPGVMSRLNIHSAIVSKHEPGSFQWQDMITCIRWLSPLRPVVRFTRGVEIKEVCDFCFAVHNEDYRNKLVETVAMELPTLEWTELPHGTCGCSNLSCGADQHIVQIDCVPRDSVLVAFVKVPPEWRSGNEAMVSVYFPTC